MFFGQKQVCCGLGRTLRQRSKNDVFHQMGSQTATLGEELQIPDQHMMKEKPPFYQTTDFWQTTRSTLSSDVSLPLIIARCMPLSTSLCSHGCKAAKLHGRTRHSGKGEPQIQSSFKCKSAKNNNWAGQISAYPKSISNGTERLLIGKPN